MTYESIRQICEEAVEKRQATFLRAEILDRDNRLPLAKRLLKPKAFIRCFTYKIQKSRTFYQAAQPFFVAQMEQRPTFYVASFVLPLDTRRTFILRFVHLNLRELRVKTRAELIRKPAETTIRRTAGTTRI